MLIKTDKDDFQKALQTAGRALSTQSTLPILSGVLIRTDDQGVEMQSTNLDMAIRTNVKATVEEQGTVAVPARLLGDIFRALPAGAVRLESHGNGNKLELSAGRSKFELSTLSAEDFPPFPTIESGVELEVNGAEFVGALSQLLRSTARDETRPILNGVLFSYASGLLELVSTDSYRLSRRELKIKNGPKDSVTQVVPYRALDEVAKSGAAKTIRVVLGESQALFETEKVIITTRLIEGKFPDYKRLLPGEQKHSVLVSKEEFLGAMNRSSLLVEKNNAVHMTVGPGNLNVKSESAGLGAVQEDVPVESSVTEEFVVAFNVRYLLDGVASTEGEKIRVGLESPTHPAVFLSEEQKDFLYLIMPLRT